jgi:GAF domain-containing protein
MSGWQIDEEARLAALHETGILDAPDDARFDALVAQAAALCGTPVALVTLLDRERQWFKAKVGTDLCDTPVGVALCRHAIGREDVLVIPDLSADPRTAINPLVTQPPHARFYAGAPLTTANGQTLGTLCVLDYVVHPEGLSAGQAAGLEARAAEAMAIIARGPVDA